MNNVFNFLLDYYVWILVVLAVIIITIIGFLVDSKQKRRKKETEQSGGLNEVKTVEPLPNDAEKLDVGMHDGLSNYSQLQTVQQPIQNVVNSSNLTSNNQVPHIDSNNVSLYKQNDVVSNNVVNTGPRPVATVPINQNMQQNRSSVSQVPNAQYGYQVNNTGTYASYGNNVNSYNNSQNITQVGQTVMNNNNVSNMTSNYNSVNQTNPSQNAMMQPNIIQNSGAANSVNSLNQNIKMPQNTVNSSVGVTNNSQLSSQVQNVSTTPGIGINFVTGYSGNSEDDTWKL